MSSYTLYKLYKKQKRLSGSTDSWEDVYPQVFSYDGGGTMTPVIVEEDSPSCGYVPPVTPQYRWVDMDISTNYYCEGTTKYYKQKRQISLDSGTTWNDMSPMEYQRGTSAETASTDCGAIEPIYEWRNITPTVNPSTYICDDCTATYRTTSGTAYCSGASGYDKYVDVYSQVSYDGGTTWETTATTPTLVEAQSTDCGYVPPVTPQYRWTKTNDTICVEKSRYRTISGTPYCSGYNKMVDVTTEVSYDSGSTWEFYSSAATLVEAQSTDCGYVPPQYRRTCSGNYCIGCVVYCDIYSEISYDNGSNWDITAITPTVVSDDCGECANTEYSALVLQSGSTYYINGLTALTWQRICRTYDTNTAFAKAVTSVKIGKSITTLANYSSVGTFSSMSIDRILIPNTVTAIEDMAFGSCDYITTVYIPDSVQGSLGVECFYHCDKLSSIRIGSGITYLGRECFNYSTKLETIIITAVNPPSLGSYVFARTNLKRIYVPAESVEAYKSAWGMASIIKPIPY